jgi:hypothetical protein
MRLALLFLTVLILCLIRPYPGCVFILKKLQSTPAREKQYGFRFEYLKKLLQVATSLPFSFNHPESGAATVFIRGRLALPIYVRVGNARPGGKILEAAWKTLEGKGQLPALKVHNQGNAHLRMNGFFSARSSTSMKFEGIVPGLPLLPGQIRWIPLEFQGEKPPPGSELELTLHVDLGAGERKVRMKVLQVVDKPKKGQL